MTLSGCFLLDLGQQGSQETLGVVSVEAALVTDSCGPGFQTGGAIMAYDVELIRNGSTLTWAMPNNSASGTCDDDGRFCIEVAQALHVRDPDPWLGDPGCDMLQLERLCGTIELVEEELENGDLVDRAVGLTARHETFVSATDGTACPEMIGLQTGQVLALPCQVSYELVGIGSFE